MKKKIIVIVGVLVLIAVIVLGLIFLYESKKSELFKNRAWLEKHISLKTSKISNEVLIMDAPKDISAYNMLYQSISNEVINATLKMNEYNIENPLIIYNPYKTNKNSVNIYFNTEEEAEIKYTIKVDGYSNFTRTLKNYENNKTHSYQLIGFVMGKENTLILEATDKNNNVKTYTFKLDFTKYESGVQKKLKVKTKNDEKQSDGLFTILGNDNSNGDTTYIYDNDGILRGEIPIIGYRTARILFDEEDIYMAASERRIVKINNLGQVEEKYNLGRYKYHHDYVFDKDKNLLILASDTKKDTCEDIIIRLNTKTGKVDKVLDLEDLFPELRENAYYEEDEVNENVESSGVDWMHINTIQYIEEEDSIILSSRETSSIIKIKNPFDNPKIEYIIGEESFWKDYDEKQYLLEKIGDFTIQGGQHTVTYEETEEDGVYYLYMFNNNMGVSTTVPDYDWEKEAGLKFTSPKNGKYSLYYKYKVNEKNKTFELINSFKVPFSGYVSSAQEKNGNIIIDSGGKGIFSEYNNKGEIIKQYKMNFEKFIYRVFKYDYTNLFQTEE